MAWHVSCPSPLIGQHVLSLSTSIVTYVPDLAVLARTLASLDRALSSLQAERGCEVSICIVDNSPVFELQALEHGFTGHIRFIGGQGNVGFGRGHNLCLAAPEEVGDLHLILNPDVELAPDALVAAIDFMHAHPDCVLASPAASSDSGERLSLCKRYPSVLDLGLRGFAPRWLKRRFDARLAQYEMRSTCTDGVSWDIPIVSGCFMLFRGEALRRLDGFDPRFFLYFEDFDLSLRAARLGRLAYVPSIRIIHYGGHAARKGWKHVAMFARSGVQFFNKHGWKLW